MKIVLLDSRLGFGSCVALRPASMQAFAGMTMRYLDSDWRCSSIVR